MKIKIITASVILLIFLPLFISSSTTAKHKSSCISCHTDEAALKSLCKLPAVPTGEAEG